MDERDTDSRPRFVARIGEVPAGKSKKFVLSVGGREVECFVVHWGGGHYAYVNKCRHIAMSLDWVENRFFDEDGRYVLCATHGALFEPTSGECVAGPPFGKRLIAVPLEVRGDEIYARVPQAFEDVL
ncbi:MAG: Rieske 2Fe-2S domain-containing protein [Deltaproteobacteria bacterium]|nr:Rieske 2Fe-2S domain-containing protein [Deltaproteobacteria bacterium]